MKQLLTKQTLKQLSKYTRILSQYHHQKAPITAYIPHSTCSTKCLNDFFHIQQKTQSWGCKRYIHTAEKLLSESETESEDDDDATMNEFLSRFVWIMRGKLMEVYQDFDKKTIDGMLLVIVGKVVSELEKGGFDQIEGFLSNGVSEDFSEDLWKTVCEVSYAVLDDMEKTKRKEKMKNFLQAEEVKEMCRFAGEVGIRGEMLREYRFKWAREKMEESEFYSSLERLKEEEEKGVSGIGDVEQENDVEESKVVSLPKRRGKINYKIYGLDLSDLKWSEVDDKIHEAEKIIWPQEPKEIVGKCKIITEEIISLQEEDDPSQLIAEWVELLQPSRVDWINLLDRLKEQNARLYLKIAEHVLGE